ncbi:NAD-dependent epimerase/dehydratase family protein [Polynucleobacter paneuropaeus]|nr:NAD-dependent epimerase/dehydratase family protein [Polynucleobacter paneuropaeus]QWD09502.1 NAD-dependent epimerase/dehydratase family protein [Polynucleobacter paneuropaeus]
MKNIVITGGCGFVGSSLALKLKEKYQNTEIICFDNLKRRGAELNIEVLQKNGIKFQHGDVRIASDLASIKNCQLLLDCSAEASVTAGYGESPNYVTDTNLIGTLNCLEFCREKGAKLIFLSTSRVYPIELMQSLSFIETKLRYEISENQKIIGASKEGINEDFSLKGARSIYGATKLCSEIFIGEYSSIYGLDAIINRCGLIAGPGQFGKSDQGVVALWMARHFWKGELAYIGYQGNGKQVRDILNISDLALLIVDQIDNFDLYKQSIFNVGGGLKNSASLLELTQICEKITGNHIEVKKVNAEREADIKCYISNNLYIQSINGWAPESTVEETLNEIYGWLVKNNSKLKGFML